jgi:ATP-dependent DNA helicase RecQ
LFIQEPELNIKYWVDDMLDDDQQEEIHRRYFMESESDSGTQKNLMAEYDLDEHD